MTSSLDASTLQQIARLPAFGLAAAAIEKVMPAARRYAAGRDLLRPMLDELWSWLASDKPAGKLNMSEAEAKAMPSGQLYHVHRHRLFEAAIAEQGKVRQLLGAAFSNLTFSIWLIDRYERTMNPGKPIVLGNDLAEVTWEQLAIGLRMMPEAADDRDEVLAWQTRTVERLIARYPCSADPDDFGPPLAKDDFLI